MWGFNRRDVDRAKCYFKKKLEEQTKLIADDYIAKNNALIRFYFNTNPDKLSDTTWAKRVAELDYVLKKAGVLVEQQNG